MSLDGSCPTSSGVSFESSRVSISPDRCRISRTLMQKSFQISLMHHREIIPFVDPIDRKIGAANLAGLPVAVRQLQHGQLVFDFFGVKMKHGARAHADARLAKYLQV